MLVSTLILSIKYPFCWMQIERKPLQSAIYIEKTFSIFNYYLEKESIKISNVFHTYRKHLYLQIYIYNLDEKIVKSSKMKISRQPISNPIDFHDKFYISHWKKKRDEGRIRNALSRFSRRANRIDRGNRVSSRLLDPFSHNNLTQAWRVKPWPGIQGCYVKALFQNFKRSRLIWSNLTDFYERSFKSESTIDPEKPRVPEKERSIG